MGQMSSIILCLQQDSTPSGGIESYAVRRRPVDGVDAIHEPDVELLHGGHAAKKESEGALEEEPEFVPGPFSRQSSLVQPRGCWKGACCSTRCESCQSVETMGTTETSNTADEAMNYAPATAPPERRHAEGSENLQSRGAARNTAGARRQVRRKQQDGSESLQGKATFRSASGNKKNRRKQQEPMVWEGWMRTTTTGRQVTLLTPFPLTTDKPISCCNGTKSWLFLDVNLTKLTLRTVDGEPIVLTILLDSILAIGSAADFMFCFDQTPPFLSDTEKDCAVLLQYVAEEDAEYKHVCFLAECSTQRYCFVEALTALWLEKRRNPDLRLVI